MKITVQSKNGELTFDCGERESILHAGLRQGINLAVRMRDRHLRNVPRAGDVGRRRCALEGRARRRAAQARQGRRSDVSDAGRARIACCGCLPNSSLSDNTGPAMRHGIIRGLRTLTRDVMHFDLHLTSPMSFRSRTIRGARSRRHLPAAAPIRWSISKPTSSGSRSLSSASRAAASAIGCSTNVAGEAEVEVFGPLGRAVFRPQEDRNFVCIAGGSGIAGMMSILECATQADYFRDHKGAVFFGVRTLADASISNSLSRYVAASHGNLDVTVALSDETIGAQAARRISNPQASQRHGS